jgi:hypothetical protein
MISRGFAGKYFCYGVGERDESTDFIIFDGYWDLTIGGEC